jgi:hypothetical protein
MIHQGSKPEQLLPNSAWREIWGKEAITCDGILIGSSASRGNGSNTRETIFDWNVKNERGQSGNVNGFAVSHVVCNIQLCRPLKFRQIQLETCHDTGPNRGREWSGISEKIYERERQSVIHVFFPPYCQTEAIPHLS